MKAGTSHVVKNTDTGTLYGIFPTRSHATSWAAYQNFPNEVELASRVCGAVHEPNVSMMAAQHCRWCGQAMGYLEAQPISYYECQRQHRWGQ